jgi:predicted dehydrogenase
MKKIGIVGFGSMGSSLGHDFGVATGGLGRVAAVVEPDDDKFSEGCKFISYAPERCNSITALLGLELDGIVISSPNNRHLENLRELGNRELPVLLEKPLDSSFEKICDVLRFAENYRGPIVVDHVMRYAPIVAKAKELIDAGAIGKICSASFVQNCFYGDLLFHNSFRRSMATGGGMFIEKATHDFDIMLHLLESRPAKVSAIARMQAYGGDKPDDLQCRDCEQKLSCNESIDNIQRRYGDDVDEWEIKGRGDLCVYAKAVDVPDNEMCMIEFENGTFGSYRECFFSPASYPSREYEITGLEGIMKIAFSLGSDHDKGRLLVCPRFGTLGDEVTYDFDYGQSNHYSGDAEVAKHFCRVVDGDQAPFTTVRQAFLAEVLGHAATLAAQSGEFVYPENVLPADLKHVWSEL